MITHSIEREKYEVVLLYMIILFFTLIEGVLLQQYFAGCNQLLNASSKPSEMIIVNLQYAF